MINKRMLEKYDVPVPRYTSYPTVPYWTDSPTTAEWIESLNRILNVSSSTWSMYVHVPFCETLCTFCGCNTTITRNHAVESPYVNHVLKELDLYLDRVPELARRPMRQLHLGGGTPTFLHVQELTRLVSGILQRTRREASDFEGGVEVDPRRTQVEQLQALYDLGFRRISLGVQDFDPEVQRLVNRIQPFEMTQKITEQSRQLGYESVNFDLIYGLPKQSLESFARSIALTIQLRPDRIALYSLAKVPWIKPQQRLFKDSDLPEGADKRALFEMAYNQLLKAGYVEIGMDHFALPSDGLTRALREARLHRNFMGYTDMRTDVLLGLGVSSISETPDCFHQNEKVLPVYERRIQQGEIPTLRGHKLDVEDRQQREQILKFMTEGRVTLISSEQVEDVQKFLQDMIHDGLVRIDAASREFSITDAGRPFLRNACVALDQRLRRQKPTTKVFSQAL